MRSIFQRLAFICVWALLATGCAPKRVHLPPPPPDFAWLEAPLDNSQLPLGPVEVKSYGFSKLGLTLSELSVNGVVLRTDPLPTPADPQNDITYISQPWQPPGPGTYILSIRFQTKSGNWINGSKSITLRVVGAEPTTQPASPTGAPATTTVATVTATVPGTNLPTTTATRAAPSATLTASKPASTGTRAATATATASATLAPSATATLAPSATATASATTGAPFTTFTADSLAINAGQCTTLRWTSGNISAIFLNGQGVIGNDNRQVCPPVTTAYELKATSSSGDVVKTLTITVTGPTATTAAASTATNTSAPSLPSIGSYNTSTNIFDNYPDCATHPTSVTITVAVDNATGVIIHYHVVGDPSTYGGPMTNTTGNLWSRTITGGSDIPDTIVGELQFSFTASNGAGPVDSGTYGGVTFNDCAS